MLPSCNRHRKHVMQLETLLRLLDNDQLPVDDTLNETRDLLEDYLDRNQVRIQSIQGYIN
jgi:CCR4-NOT transcription complex subunit 3